MGYLDTMRPYAQRASTATGVPVAVILAQWAIETGAGTSPASRPPVNNHAGIMTSGKLRAYASIDAFTDDYIATLKLPYYEKVLSRARSGDSWQNVAEELGRSPWDADRYRQVDSSGRPIKGTEGFKLTQYIGQYAAQLGATAGLDPASPLTAEQVAAIEKQIGIRLSDDVRKRLMSASTSATERAQILAQTGADLGRVTGGIPILDPALDAVQSGVGTIAGGAGDVLGLAGKALGVLTSAEFWRRAGLIAGGVGLLVVGVIILAKE